MLNRSASLAMSTCVLKALPGNLDIKRHSPSILYVPDQKLVCTTNRLSAYTEASAMLQLPSVAEDKTHSNILNQKIHFMIDQVRLKPAGMLTSL